MIVVGPAVFSFFAARTIGIKALNEESVVAVRTESDGIVHFTHVEDHGGRCHAGQSGCRHIRAELAEDRIRIGSTREG